MSASIHGAGRFPEMPAGTTSSADRIALSFTPLNARLKLPPVTATGNDSTSAV